MSLDPQKSDRLQLMCVALVMTCSSLSAAEFVTNGSFSTNSFPAGVCGTGVTTCNIEFDNNYTTPNVVSNWTSTGYAIYFIAGKQTTQSAVGRWGASGSEMLDTASTTLSPSGGNFVGLDADPTIGSTLSQTISGLTANRGYSLTYYWAASQLQSRTGVTNNDSVQVTFGTDVAQSVHQVLSLPSGGFSGWYAETVHFVAHSSTQTLTFLAKSTSTCLPPMVLIDGVSIQQTPEPGTMALMGIGLTLITAAALRRQKKL